MNAQSFATGSHKSKSAIIISVEILQDVEVVDIASR